MYAPRLSISRLKWGQTKFKGFLLFPSFRMSEFNTKGLFTWSGGLRSSGVGFFCFHALGDIKQKKPTPLDQGPPHHVNRV